MVKAPKKLIEVALPLDDINENSIKEKSIRLGHPSNLHLWWARRPFVTARAILFAQLVNDPGGERGWSKNKTKEEAENERKELFEIVRNLSDFKRSNDTNLLEVARQKIKDSWKESCRMAAKEGWDPDSMPPLLDPFSGGGAIPFEAQRLGLHAIATDINPIPVMINKCLLHYPSIFKSTTPVCSINKKKLLNYDQSSAQGLREDVNLYADIVLNKVKEKVEKFYPKVSLPSKIGGGYGEVVSYIWARTVESPSPAYSGIHVPLLTTFWLCSKKNKEAWISIEHTSEKEYKFMVNYGKRNDLQNVKNGTKKGRGANFQCILSGSPISSSYIKEQAQNGKLGSRLVAVAVLSKNGRIYIEPRQEDVDAAASVPHIDSLQVPLSTHSQYMGVTNYGFSTHADLYTKRQLYTLNAFVLEIRSIRNAVIRDCQKSSRFNALFPSEKEHSKYADAIVTYLALALGKLADINNSLAAWGHIQECPLHLFTRQAIPMVWDFAEANPVGPASGSWSTVVKGVCRGINSLGSTALESTGESKQINATELDFKNVIISTDPPYYDNVPYSDLSDFFYVWQRPILRDLYPEEFSTITTPKHEELVADSKRWNGRDHAERFFSSGMELALSNMANCTHPVYPVTIYYAFKQTSTKNEDTASIGWESFLSSVIHSGFCITGTWPLRTERAERMRGQGSNALASSILLVCRKRNHDTENIPRRQFLREIKEELPLAIEEMIGGKTDVSPIAPVDLAQAAIGPGMAVFSRYSGIIEADGSKMSVHDALIQINKVIDEFFNEAEGDMDSDTRFCIDWFMQYGFKQAEYGQADVLARAKGTTVEGLAVAGVVETGGGKVRLLKFEEYPENWDPEKDTRTPTWEALHQLIRALRSGGEAEAGLLLKKMAERTESIRQLAYRLYTLCERKGWAEEARAYNELIASWHGTIEAAEQAHGKSREAKQLTLDM
jgi:putative DNA methylase